MSTEPDPDPKSRDALAVAAAPLVLDLQCATLAEVPSQEDFEHWVSAALAAGRSAPAATEMTIRLVDEAESAALNRTYRGRTGPTNVLSFPFELPPGAPATGLLGDLVICAPLVLAEAADQGKSPRAHWAHMVVHGTLHLLGHDHQDDDQASAMEALETRIITSFGFENPYESDSGPDDQ
ncbi:rRNA maturation RNase YbeY [Thiorhodovibrio winogradskyi]|nr:rRNA maturation RNase YbeY [Thiorhodovibrio winogradskyi]